MLWKDAATEPHLHCSDTIADCTLLPFVKISLKFTVVLHYMAVENS